MNANLPPMRALVGTDDELRREELLCLVVREQAAALHALCERLECSISCLNVEAQAELIEELARLACRALELAASMSKMIEPVPERGLNEFVAATVATPS